MPSADGPERGLGGGRLSIGSEQHELRKEVFAFLDRELA